MNPRPEDVEALARAVDRVVFAETGGTGDRVAQSASLALISYLTVRRLRVVVTASRRDRLQRRLMRALGIPNDPTPSGWVRLEVEVNRRLRDLAHRGAPGWGGGR